MTRWFIGIGLAVAVSLAFLIYTGKPTASPHFPAMTYERVVSLAPSMTETMVALKQTHRLVGVTIHCLDPDVLPITKIGSFAEPNFEAIMAQNPDLVLGVPHVMAKPILEKLERSGIQVFAHQPDSLKDIAYVVAALAQKFGISDDGRLINEKIDRAILAARDVLNQSAFPANKRTALIAVSYLPFVVAGKGTFASEIIEAMGLTNLAAGKTAWPVWPLEKLITEPPAYLIVSGGNEVLPKFLNIFTALRIEANRITVIAPDAPIFYSPSPNIIKDIQILTDLFVADV